MSPPTVKVRPTSVSTKAPAGKEKQDASLRGDAKPERGKGFIRRCVEIIIQDALDKLYRDRKRKREEYERICELAYGSTGRKNGG